MDLIKQFNPLFCEMRALTLEELFISEMEEAGYDINNLFHIKSLPENRAGQKQGNQALVSAVCRFISGFLFSIFLNKLRLCGDQKSRQAKTVITSDASKNAYLCLSAIPR